MRANSLPIVCLAVAVRAGAAHAQGDTLHHAAPTARDRLVLQGFADVNMRASTARDEQLSFSLGQFALFLTSRLSDRLTFLAEAVLEYDDAPIADLERLLVTWEAHPALRVAAGRHHTPIGYWNARFHHGSLIQPTIGRPEMFAFEDEGGMLPVHTTGILVSGRGASRLRVDYDVLVGNGIGSSDEGDNDAWKSWTGRLGVPVGSALQLGVSAYVDRVAAGTPVVGEGPLVSDADARVLGGYAVYEGPAVEWIAEYQRLGHTDRATAVSSRANAFYVHAGYRVGDVVPYARIDLLERPTASSWFGTGDTRQSLVGIRRDLGPQATVRLEAGRRRTAGGPRTTLVAAQVAIGF